MTKALSFFMEHRLVTTVFLSMLLALGFVSLSSMNREAFPKVTLDKVVIQTPYPGGTPEEIERLVSIPLEKQLRSVSNIDEVRSYNLENVSVIMVFLKEGMPDTRPAVEDIKDAVERTALPPGALAPTVEEITTDKQQVVDVAFSLKQDGAHVPTTEEYRMLRDTAKAFEDKLYELPEIAEVERFGYRNRQFLVEADPAALNAKRVGLNQLLNVLGMRNVDMPSGVMRLNGTEYLLRTRGQFSEALEMRSVPIVGNATGFMTVLSDVAQVFDTFEDPTIYEKYDGSHVIVLRVWKTETADIINAAEAAKATVEKMKERYPEVEVTVFLDQSTDVVRQLNDLIMNFVTGLTLVVAALFFILGFRLSMIISLAIPSIFLIAFTIIHAAGITINTISIFALVMVLGMMVDNSIVVAENSFRLMQEGQARGDAIRNTLSEVFAPLLVTMLAIGAAFAPLLFMGGIIGKFVFGIPAVILIVLVVSLVFSLVFLPSWLNTFLPERVKATYGGDDEEAGGFGLIVRAYRKTMAIALRYRYAVIGGFTVFFFGLLFLAGRFLPFVLFPAGGEDQIDIKTYMPQGTTLQRNLEVMDKAEGLITEVVGDQLVFLRDRVGIHEPPFDDPKPGEETHRSTVIVKLTPVQERDDEASAAIYVKKIRDRLKKAQQAGELPAEFRYDVEAALHGPPVGKPVSLQIRGPEFAQLKEIAALYMKELEGMPGVYDVSLDLEEGKEEFRFYVKDDVAAKAGLSVNDVAESIRTAFNGEVASSISKGEDRINIVVRFPDEARHKIESLKKVKVQNNQGRLVPLERVAYFTRERSYSMINRQDLMRVVRVEASVDTDLTTSLDVNRLLQKKIDISKDYQDYSVNFGGEQEDAQESFTDLVISFAFAMGVIFAIFLVYFNSATTTGVVMGAIPFGIAGVLLGLMLHGKPLSFMSMLAIVALSGSIVANTLVLVTFTEELRKKGQDLHEAIINAGAIRLRPVLLTTVTTVIGLLPSAYGIPTVDHFVQPLSLSFAWGLMFATLITLVLCPLLYMMKEDFLARLRKA